MISLILFGLAAALNACMDTLVHHFDRSIFPQHILNTTEKQWSRYTFWDPSVSWVHKYVGGSPKNGLIKWWIFDKPVFLTDGWHLFKSLSIACLCLSVVMFDQGTWLPDAPKYIKLPVVFVLYGTIWNVTFSLFYNKILIKKK